MGALRSLVRRMPPPVFTAFAGTAAFCAYFSMYAFRKPFAAANYLLPGWPYEIDYKSALLTAQVLGYALSKLIGIRVIAEIGRHGRAQAIVGLIALAWAALLMLALVPAPWSIACLFVNGLPLGMIWGLVFSYLEGRRTSEMLGAMLCASFILSSGAVKSAAVLMMQAGMTETWMPAATGALFFPLLIASVIALEALPPPDAADEAERTVRVPMLKADRVAFLRDHGLAMMLLVLGYVLLTAIRDFRDNFAAEIWAGLGYRDVAAMFSASELPVAAIALVALGSLMAVRNNMRALLAMHMVIIGGAALLGLSTLAFQAGLLPPLTWMILTGAGLYLAYTPFNAMLFDRMVAAIGRAGNAGFLIYIADASGYLGSVALLLYRSLAAPGSDWLGFYIHWAYVTAVIVTLLTFASAVYFIQRERPRAAALSA
ncbi:DUF5690 family protein [Sphingomonas quercus]|uniref:MFS transporter n=1 Tax=Sphingomonas quercus TaxID=2842451 RepID=A0ABS6BJ86_9SPHN|nr:DUF5690 family protein [Sphingomonas quercus]MBU3077907.1 hypothetical protein [Sphingomonas quercus]